MELLGELGYQALTIEAIAARAGVGRPTVYRRWRTREEIVIAALTRFVRPLRDTGSGQVRDDLYQMLADLVSDLDARVGPSVLGVHAAIRPDSPLAEALLDRYLRPRAAILSRLFARGQALGQLRADLSEGTLRNLIFGPPIYHLLLTGEPMSPDELRVTFDAMWRAVAANPVDQDTAGL